MGFEIKNVKGDVSPQMIELAQAVVAACEERGVLFRILCRQAYGRR